MSIKRIVQIYHTKGLGESTLEIVSRIKEVTALIEYSKRVLTEERLLRQDVRDYNALLAVNEGKLLYYTHLRQFSKLHNHGVMFNGVF